MTGTCRARAWLPLQSKNEASAKYDKINNVLQDKASNGGTSKQKRMSIESADMEKIEHDRRSKPMEAAAEDRQMGMK